MAALQPSSDVDTPQPRGIKTVHRVCPVCEKDFQIRSANHQFCSIECYGVVSNRGRIAAENLPTSTTGAISELSVAAALMRDGWAVFRSMSPACFCDIVAFKDGVARFIEVRTGAKFGVNHRLNFGTKMASGATEIAVYVPEDNSITVFSREEVQALRARQQAIVQARKQKSFRKEARR